MRAKEIHRSRRSVELIDVNSLAGTGCVGANVHEELIGLVGQGVILLFEV